MSILSNILSKPPRKVRRILVMIDFEDQSEGDVYDFTALCAEMFSRAPYSANLGVRVHAESGYKDGKRVLDHFHVKFDGDGGEWCCGATHIEDVVNFALPDGEKVKALKAKSARLAKKSEDLKRDAMYAKLMQVVDVRHQHPIAKFTATNLPALPEPR